MSKEVRFFGTKGRFGLFSNFAETPLWIGGLRYPTSEHYFQSMKFIDTDPDWAENVRQAETPLISKKLGQSRDHPISRDWSRGEDGGISVVVMRRVLLIKLLQNVEFRELLFSVPKDTTIIEASPWDYYWGEGKKKTGKNMLGKLLMELRTFALPHKDTMFTPDDL